MPVVGFLHSATPHDGQRSAGVARPSIHPPKLRELLDIMEDKNFLDVMERAPELFEDLLRLNIECTIPSFLSTLLEEASPREKFNSVSDWLAMLREVISGLLHNHRDPEPEVLLDRAGRFTRRMSLTMNSQWTSASTR